MTSIKNPIERLLIYADNHLYERGGSNTLWEDVMDIADEIEAQYMKLPVDADGVPIRPGDRLVGGGSIFEAHGVTGTSVWDGDRPCLHDADSVRHSHIDLTGMSWPDEYPRQREEYERVKTALEEVRSDRDFWRNETIRLRELLDAMTKQMAKYQDEIEDGGLA